MPQINDDDIFEQDELKDAVRAVLVREGGRLLRTSDLDRPQVSWSSWVTVYVAIIGLALTAVSMFAQNVSRMSNIETRLDYITQMVAELKIDLRELKNARPRP